MSENLENPGKQLLKPNFSTFEGNDQHLNFPL
jgi:hypothetical protein